MINSQLKIYLIVVFTIKVNDYFSANFIK